MGCSEKQYQQVEKRKKKPDAVCIELEYILDKLNREEILAILENDSEESVRLRSSSPFTGILSDIERKVIFELYSRDKQLKQQ